MAIIDIDEEWRISPVISFLVIFYFFIISFRSLHFLRGIYKISLNNMNNVNCKFLDLKIIV